MVRAIVARFIGAKTKDCSQVPDMSWTTRQLSFILLQKSSLWGHRPTTMPMPIGPRKARTQRCRTSLCLISPSSFLPLRIDNIQAVTNTALGPALQPVWLLGAQGCYKKRECKQMSSRPLLSFDYISLGFGRSKLLSNQPIFFLILHMLVLGPPPSNPFPGYSRILCLYPILSFLQIFPGQTPPLYSHHIGSYCKCLSRGISPSWVSTHLIT